MAKKKVVTGIHIGDDTVRMVQIIHQKDGFKAGCAALSPVQGYFDATERIKNTVQAIVTCQNSIGRRINKSHFTVSCLNWPDVLVTTFNLPEMSTDELETALLFEIEQVCPFEISTSVIDYQLIEDDKGEAILNDGQFCGVAAVAPQHLVQEHFAIMKKSGLKNNVVDADCMALLNCHKYMGGNQNAAIVNIDMAHTIVAVPTEIGIPFVRNIDFGGKNILNSIIKARGVKKDEFADTLQAATENLSSDLLNVLDKSCSNLAKSISRTLQFCLADNPNCDIQEILLTGELSLMPIIVDILNKELDWELKAWNPFKEIDTKNITGQDLLAKTGSAFAITAGLAIREPEYV